MLINFVLLYSAILLVLYIYFGYPVLLGFFSGIFRKKILRDNHFPEVSLLITAYNEGEKISGKIVNSLELDYPKEKLEIIVVSDASEDDTDEKVKDFFDKNVKLLRVEGRVGKTAIQNQAVKIAKGEIIIFSDATTKYEPDLIEKIVRNFNDNIVGGVAGNLVYLKNQDGQVSLGGGLYWGYEKFIRQKESDISSVIGVSGCCYAVRKELYKPLPSDIISDFIIAQLIYMQGYRVVHEPEAKCYEFHNDSIKADLKMRVRVAVRTLHGLVSMKKVLNPFKYGIYSFQIFSHKILRYLVPFLFIEIFIINLVIVKENFISAFGALLIAQCFFYSTPLFGKIKYLNSFRLVKVINYFIYSNVALFLGVVMYLKGERYVVWNTARAREE